MERTKPSFQLQPPVESHSVSDPTNAGGGQSVPPRPKDILRRRRTAPQAQGSRRRVSHPSLEYRALLPERFEVDLEKRYILDKLVLGEGGYGKVFVARDNKFESRLVAVKKLTKTDDVDRTEAYEEEMRIMKTLDHPGICKLFETWVQGRHLFFVMEYCAGGEVFDRIIEHGVISEPMTADIIAQVAAALHYAHLRQIAHRDIKPENVVFCTKDPKDLRVKVIDWGLAVCFAGHEMRSAVGSFAYSAPEVMMATKRGAYDCQCDMWSLGVMTYVMLCGKPPFWGSPQHHLKKARAERYPMSDAPWDHISDAAKDLIRGLLKADPAERLNSGDAIVHKWLSRENRGELADQHPFVKEVVQNLVQYRDHSLFMQLCVTAVACQLDHADLKDIHKVFCELDKNGDGTLSLDEVGKAWKETFGVDIDQETFAALDLNGSGAIDYTEFCAAGLGHATATKADVVWAAFKLFDLDDNGKLSVSEIQSVLHNADVRHEWTDKVCAAVAKEVIERYDGNGDGDIEFEEWMKAMNDCWERRHSSASSSPSMSPSSQVNFGGTPLHRVYHSLSEVMGPLPHSVVEVDLEGGSVGTESMTASASATTSTVAVAASGPGQYEKAVEIVARPDRHQKEEGKGRDKPDDGKEEE